MDEVKVGQLFLFEKGTKFPVDGQEFTAKDKFVAEVVSVEDGIVQLLINKQAVSMPVSEVLNLGERVEKKEVKFTEAEKTYIGIHDSAVLFINLFNQALILDNVTRDERKQSIRELISTGTVSEKVAGIIIKIIEEAIKKPKEEAKDVSVDPKSVEA
jgi:hypothetical protein